MSALASIRKRIAAVIDPPQRLRISEWAEREGYVGEGAEVGKFSLRSRPHEAAMLDDPQDPGVREIYWMLASQAGGKTMCLILLCEFAIAKLKRSLLMVRDTKDRALEWMRDKFLPAAENTAAMQGLLIEPRKRGSNSTSLSRRFPGGVFKLVGAKSRGAFRSGSFGIVMQDEIDSYETTKEGDPCALADRATITFGKGCWKIKSSTPTLKGFSRIHAGFLTGDKQYYFLPCPLCGGMQSLKTEQLKFSFTAEEYERFSPGCDVNDFAWSLGNFAIRDTRRAIYVCEHCRHGWTDRQRIASYLSGHPDNPPVVVDGKSLRAEWRATAKFNGVRSRHLNGMYIVSGLKEGFDSYLQMFAEQFLAAKSRGRDSLMAWTNMFKDEPWEDAGETLEWKTIKDRAEDYLVPAQAVWIAGGLDVHPDRVEILFYGWGEGQEAWCLSHHIIFGDFDMPSCQERVWEYLDGKRFNHPIIGEMKWSAIGIDCGHQTKVKAVYQFAARHRIANVFAVKGFDDLGGAIYQRVTEKVYGGTRLNLNVDVLKTMIYDRLRNKEPGPRYIHFSAEREGRFGEQFYEQLCSEKRMPTKMPSGGYVFRWVKKTSSTRNEILDMTVYAFGIYEVCRQEEWIARKWKEVQSKIRETVPLSPPTVVTTQAPAEAKRADIKPAQPRPQFRRRFRIASPFRRF